ncbi:MAG: hypothetical protein ABFS35_22915 [Bacteroidota bacterium]
MQNWSTEIQELKNYNQSLSGKFPELEKEFKKLLEADDEVVVLLYSRRCLEVIVNDVCEKEAIKLGKTIPLKGKIDKLNKEDKAPSHIISSMLNLNTISTYGAHPKEFDSRQTRTVIINLTTILDWYLKYNQLQKKDIIETTQNEQQELTNKNENPKRSWVKVISVLFSVAITVAIVLVIINKVQENKKLAELEKTIAVLPFESLGEENKEALHDAIPIALIMELQNVEEFTVRPRGSTLKYKEKNLSSLEIGKELKVNFLVKGFTQKHDNMVSVNIMLINALLDEVIWNRSFEFETDDIFQIQREISKQVAFSLVNSFNPTAEKLTDNPDAYLAYLTGMRYYWDDDSKESLQKCKRYMEKAIQLDSTFTMAYVKLAAVYFWMYQFHYERTPESLSKGRKILNKALELNPGNYDAILTEGIYFYAIYEYEKALEKYELAKEGATDKVDLNACIAAVYRRQLQFDKSIEYFSKAAELDPQNKVTVMDLAENYLLTRKYDLAEKQYNQLILMGATFKDIIVDKILLYLIQEEGTEKSKEAFIERKSLLENKLNPILVHNYIKILQIDQDFNKAIDVLSQLSFKAVHNQFIYKPISLYYAEIYRLQNNKKTAMLYYDSARVHLENKIVETPNDFRLYSSLGIAYAGLGKKDKAIKYGEKAEELMPIDKDFYRWLFVTQDLTKIYTMVGEYGSAIERLDQTLSLPGLISVNLIKKDPIWEPLWDLPEFQKMLEKHSND